LLFLLKVNFFIFTYFNRKFRRELTRVCFRTRKTLSLRTPSRHSFRGTNSNIRTLQQNPRNSQQFDVSILFVVVIRWIIYAYSLKTFLGKKEGRKSS
jgi:hypothetical protein